MRTADNSGRAGTLTPRTGTGVLGRPEDTAGGAVVPTATCRDLLKWGFFRLAACDAWWRCSCVPGVLLPE